MLLSIDDCRNMVDSWEEMLFIYNIKEDKLYFSPKACRAMGWQSEVRRYWKDSENWNYVAQGRQEELVNIVRHELLNADSLQERITLEAGPCTGEFIVEFSAVWADRAKLDMAAVKGKLIKI